MVKGLSLLLLLVLPIITFGEVVILPEDEAKVYREKDSVERISVRCKSRDKCTAIVAVQSIKEIKKRKNLLKGGRNPLSTICHLSKGRYVIIKLSESFEELDGEKYFCLYGDNSFILAGDLLDAYSSN